VRRYLRRFFGFVSSTLRRADSFLGKHPWLFAALAGTIIAAAAFIRFWAAPISAGPDIAQFWGFAKLFESHGLDFYRYADGTDPSLSVSGWGFVYPPIWLFILRLALFAAPGSVAGVDFIDTSWRIAMKSPIIAADLAIGALLLWAIPGSKVKKLFFAALWLFHPATWYNSAIFGQFDAIAAAFLLASLIMFVKGKDRFGFILAAIAVLTKQHVALPVLFMIVSVGRQISRRRLIEDCAIAFGVFLAFSVPFLFTGSAAAYVRAVFLPAIAPAYQLPLVYAFSGSGAIITYLHQQFGWTTEYLLKYDSFLLIAGVAAALAACYAKRIRVEHAALIGILLFVGIFYRINYQYLVIYIPLALCCMAISHDWSERSLAILLIAIPASWVFMFDVSFWFRVFEPLAVPAPTILGKIGMTNYVPDITYVSLAAGLMIVSLAYVGMVLSRPRTSGTTGANTVTN
jgi:hypothetical protein